MVQPLLQGKSNKCYVFWECVCSLWCPSRNAHAPYVYPCSAPTYNTFPRPLFQGIIFGKKKYLTQNVFWFSLRIFSAKFLILRTIERAMIKLYIRLHVKYRLFPLDFNEAWILSTDYHKFSQLLHGNVRILFQCIKPSFLFIQFKLTNHR